MQGDPSPQIDYRAFLESTPLVPWEAEADSGTVVYVGPQAVGLLGHATDRWLAPEFWRDHIVPDDQVAVTTARAALAADGGSYTIEYRMEHADGHIVWVSETATAVLEDGLARLRGFLGDVTDRKRLERALVEGEERLRTLIRSAPDAMIFTEADGTIINMNEQAEYLLGYTPDEVRGSSVDLLAPERLRSRLLEQRAALHAGRARRTLVDGSMFAVQRGDGEEVPVELSVSVVPFRGRRQLMYALRDLTARLRAETQLRASEGRLRGMADAMPALVCFIDASERYRFVNEAYAEWVGWDRRDMEGRHVREVLGPAVYERLRPSIEAALAGVAVRFSADAANVGAHSLTHHVDVSYVPQREGDGVIGYFVVVIEAGRTAPRRTARQRRGA